MRTNKIFLLLCIFLITIFSGSAFSATYTYDNANRLISIDHGNGTVVNYTYDANGNTVAMTVNGAVPPTGSISINYGAESTLSTSVTLSISASDSNGTVSEMRFRNDNSTWSAWEPYATTRAWTLSEGFGIKTVYAQFKDSTNDISLPCSSTIALLPQGNDLIIVSVSAPLTAVLGASISVNYQIQNIGTIPAGQSDVQLYLTTDPVNASPSDVLLHQATIGPLAEGDNYSGFVDLLPSNTVPGVYYIRAKADATGTNLELDETNNYAISSAITLTEDVDLIVESLSAPVNAQAGNQISISSTIKNLGSIEAAASSVSIYLTTDPANSLPSDILLTQSSVSAIQAGANTIVASSAVIPSNTAAGIYYIRAVADSGDVLFELEEGNNSRTSASIQVNDSTIKLFAQMDGNWLDSSGNGNNGTANGATFSTVSKYGSHSGSFSSNYVNFGNSSGLNITNAVTVEAWIKPNSTSGTQFVAGRPYSTSTSWSNPWVGWHIGVRNGKMATWLNINGVDREYDAGTITAGVWQHIVMTFDGTWRRSYINGVNVFSSNANVGTIAFSGNPNVVVGVRSSTALGEYFNGLIDNVRIYSKALTPEEVLQNYNNDNVPPAGSMLINGGTSRTNSASVTLTLSATDNSGTVSQMRFSNDNATWSTWETYSATKAWTLSAGDGNKTVYVQFKDPLANTSTYSSAITLDTAVPIVSASPVGGTFASAQNVSLSSNEQSIIYYTIDGTVPTTGSPVYSAPISINTSTALNFIGVDAAGNQSAVLTQSYIIDAVAPTGSISINDGALNTNSESVMLSLTATDDSGTVTQMRFSNDSATWSAWELYGTTKAWALSAGDGNKTVFVQYRDTVGNISTAYSSSITLDTAAPVVSAIPAGGTFASAQNVTLSANEQATIYYTIDGSMPTTASTVYGSSITINANTTLKYFGVDTVGIQSNVQTQAYTIDFPPAGSISINNAAESTSSINVTLTLSATDDSGTVSQMRFSNDNVTWSAWEPYAIMKGWILSEGNGTKTVFAEFKDSYGNISSTCSDSITASINGIDLIVSIDSVPASRPSGASMAVGYMLQNLGTATPAPFQVRFYIASDPVNTANDVLLRTESVSDIWPDGYNTSLIIPASTAAGTYYVRAVVDATNTNAETNENNNTAVSSAITITKEIDLVVSIDSVPASKPSGASMAVAYTLQNLGTATPAPFQVRFYLASDPVNTANDVLLRTESVSDIWPDGYNASLIIPSSTSAGTYYVRAVVDATNTNAETNENNNSAVSLAIMITKDIDLTVSIDSVPASKPSGASMAVGYMLQNLGTATPAPFQVRIYLASDPVNTANDVLLGTENVSAIWPDGHGMNVMIPASTGAGTYYVRAVVDATNTNAETNENNNSAVSSAITITKDIDLVVSIDSVPVSKPSGASMAVAYMLQNLGTATPAPFQVRIYLASDPVNTANDVLLGTESVSAIWPDGHGMNVMIPASTSAGTYYVRAVVDASNTNAETNEKNNIVVSSAITITKEIDLVVSIDSVPASKPSGASMAVGYMLQNLGTATPAPFQVRFYLASDPVNTANDVLLRTESVSDIWPDGYNTSLTIPASTAAGTYYVRAVVDATNTNAETNENNNISVSGAMSVTMP